MRDLWTDTQASSWQCDGFSFHRLLMRGGMMSIIYDYVARICALWNCCEQALLLD
jgi:hypothetical protein